MRGGSRLCRLTSRGRRKTDLSEYFSRRSSLSFKFLGHALGLTAICSHSRYKNLLPALEPSYKPSFFFSADLNRRASRFASEPL
jgi:hypothetical protein